MEDKMKKNQAYWLFEGGFMYAYELRDNVGKRIALIIPNPLPGQCYEGHKVHLYGPGNKAAIKTINRKDLGIKEAKQLAEKYAKEIGYRITEKREIDLDDHAELLEELEDQIIYNRKGKLTRIKRKN